MQKVANFKIKGMQRDLSASAFNPEYAYENKNIRIAATDDSTLLSIINEKGNKKVNISGIGESLKGTPIGQAVLNNEAVVFTSGDKSNLSPNIVAEDSEIDDITAEEKTLNIDVNFSDRIYKLWFNNNQLAGKLLFSGDLGFDYKHPIESLSFYENSDIRKVYWTDGLNQPRVINIASKSTNWTSDSFNFTRTLKLNETVNIERNLLAGGTFAPGVIQYAFTYFDKYGQESNIFYTSPLFYISYNNRGASPEDRVSNSFNITINNIDKNFDYIRIYSIHRTSIDATPTCKRVIDLASSGRSATSVTYTDDGESGDSIDPTELLYVGGEEVVFGTMSQKDNTLFLGDIVLKRKIIDSTIRNYFRGKTITFDVGSPYYPDYYEGLKSIPSPKPKGYYPYINQLKYNSFQFKTFKYLEWYRFGVQFQHYTGKWSEPIWINDARNTQHINNTFYNGTDIYLPIATFAFNDSTIIKRLISQGYVKARPVVVYPTINDREAICQGILCPTVYNVGDRFSNAPFAQSSWFIRPNPPFDITHTDGVYVCVLATNIKFTDFHPSQTYTQGRSTWTYYSVNTAGKKTDDSDTRVITAVVLTNNSYAASQNWPTDSGKMTAVDSGTSDFNYSSKTISRDSSWDTLDPYDWGKSSIYSKSGIMSNNSTRVSFSGEDHGTYKLADKGAWVEFRHNYPIPGNDNKNAEIQCIVNPPKTPTVNKDASNSDITDWVSNNSENYYVDQSIVTLHSPDIEFDNDIRSVDLSNVKLRIVGVVPLTSFISDIDIQTSTPVNNFKDSSDMPIGFYKQAMSSQHGFGIEGDSHFGFRGMVSAPFWFDELSALHGDVKNSNKYSTGFVVYPWHRNGSLNNTRYSSDGYRSAMLDKKKMSNTRFSYKTVYFDDNNIWNAYVKNNSARTGIAGVSIFDSNEVSLVRLPSPENSTIGEINYYGNVDKLLVMSRTGDKTDGYPIMTSGAQNSADNASKLFNGNYMGIDSKYTDQVKGTDPVRIKYKSTPHAVLNLNYSTSGAQRILPAMKEGGLKGVFDYEYWTANGQSASSITTKAFWDKTGSNYVVSQDTIDLKTSGDVSGMYGLQYGFLWLGELYNDNVTNRFGGKTEEAFENNLWVPCGEAQSFYNDDRTIKSSLELRWIEGDTYYQRYDHIKTYPFTLEDQNAVTDIISFMCETRVNIDGRYDRNRGQTSNLAITPTNFNQMNQVYSQQNNFFNYRTLNPNKLNLDNFHNSITWTKTKTAGELVDTWTNITLASTLDLDGDKGDVRALRRYNNNLFAFQDKGISHILYNENMQISTTEGVPVEIANSGKVTGKRYISDNIGCTNKWSICETPSGLFFIDDITKGIYLFNGQIDNFSDKFGFHSWLNQESKLAIWNPVDFGSFNTHYDKTTDDIFFVNKNNALAFNSALGQFTSFYSYENTPYFINLENRSIAINKEYGIGNYKVWLQNEGEYNSYFGKYQPFYTTIIANPEMTTDKIFNNLEFRADTWNNKQALLNTTFDTLTTWNEYQQGKVELANVLDRPSTLKRKFRIWRANIPRDKTHRRDRMRNPWLYIKLSMEKENTNKTILHDMAVQYFN